MKFKTYQLKKFFREWSHISQTFPNEVLIVVAIAVTILTKGAGAKLLACLNFGQISATMLNVGFSLVASKATTSFLQTGNPLDIYKGICNKQFLKEFIISVASAGLTEYGNSKFNIVSGPKIFQ